MKSIFLIMIGLSSFVFANVTKNGDIVTDTTTRLQWQDDADARNVTKTWSGAINYCENLILGGYDDWRLPNINEFKSIIDRSKLILGVVDGFTNVNATYYWSSTTRADYQGDAWYVYFSVGSVFTYDKSKYINVRCVRDVEA